MASVKCPKCGNLINGVQAGQTVTCPSCRNVMKLAPSVGAQLNTGNGRNMNAQYSGKSGGGGVKVIGILLIVLGGIGLLMGMVMFGDIGIACIVGALSALLSGIGFLMVDNRI